MELRLAGCDHPGAPGMLHAARKRLAEFVSEFQPRVGALLVILCGDRVDVHRHADEQVIRDKV